MNKFSRYPFLRIAPAFILGIVGYHYLSDYLVFNKAVLVMAIALFFALAFINSFRFKAWLGILALMILFLFGYFRLQTFRDDNHDDNLLFQEEALTSYEAVVIQESVAKKKTRRTVVELNRGWIDGKKIELSGKVNLYLEKEASETIRYGDVLLVKGNPQLMEPPSNPGEFDYRNYLVYNNIYHQHFAGDRFSVIGNSPPAKIKAVSLELRKKCKEIITNLIADEQARSIVLALVIGVKDELDPDLQAAYSSAGAMHVLAVSGLHVGIIYMLILSICRKIGLANKRGRWTLAVLSIGILWLYAFITGMSPSVLRAVTMFSFVAIAKATRRNTNIYNTLAASAFVLLWYNPYLIMSVGFQLSFLAVFGIVYLQPKFYSLIKVENKLLDKVWAITCVSIAAQIATGPLSVLYFHQFPSYFFISNLFIIPAAFIILLMGLGVLTLGWVPYVGEALAWCLEQIVTVTNSLVFQVEAIPGSVIDGIHIKTYESWLIYFGILCLIALFAFRRFKFLLIAGVMFMGFSFSQILERSNYLDQAQIDFFDVANASVLDFVSGGQTKLVGDSSFLEDQDKIRFSIEPKRMSFYQEINPKKDDLLIPHARLPGANLYVFEDKTLLKVINDSVMRYSIKEPLPIDYVAISNNSITNLNRLQEVLVFKNLILDNSNRKSVVDRLTSQAEQLNLNVYSIQEMGFLEVRLK